GVLRLPAPVVPQVVGHVLPEGVAPWLAGRLFVVDRLVERAWPQPVALFGITHLHRGLQVPLARPAHAGHAVRTSTHIWRMLPRRPGNTRPPGPLGHSCIAHPADSIVPTAPVHQSRPVRPALPGPSDHRAKPPGMAPPPQTTSRAVPSSDASGKEFSES